MNHVSYLNEMFDLEQRKDRINMAAKIILEKYPDGNITLVGTGLSGTIPVSILSHKLNLPMAIVRKEPSPNSTYQVESTEIIRDYIILDDFIFEGGTVENIINKIKKRHCQANCLEYIGLRKVTNCYPGQEHNQIFIDNAEAKLRGKGVNLKVTYF